MPTFMYLSMLYIQFGYHYNFNEKKIKFLILFRPEHSKIDARDPGNRVDASSTPRTTSPEAFQQPKSIFA